MNNVITGNYSGIAIEYGTPSIINNTIVNNLSGIGVGPFTTRPLCKQIAFVYNTDYAAAQRFKLLLAGYGFRPELIHIGDVTTTDLSPYCLIIAGLDTGKGYEWDNPKAALAIRNSRIPVLGLGDGGASLFQTIGLSINYGNSAIGFSDTMYAPNPEHRIYNTPLPIDTSANQFITLANSTVRCLYEHAPHLPLDVALLGRHHSSTDYYPLTQESQYILWGYNLEPSLMSQTGKDLFINLVSYATAVKVAFIYDTDFTGANNFNELLEVNGYPTDLIPMSKVAGTSFSQYGVIMVGNDTNWGTPDDVAAVTSSGRAVIGLGEGGYALFGKLGLATGYPHGWHNQLNDDFRVVDRLHPVFRWPHSITIPKGGIVDVYQAPTEHLAIHLPQPPSSVQTLALQTDDQDQDHYPFTIELNNYLFWGFEDSPASMTEDGQNIILNAVKLMQPIYPISRSSQLIMNNIITDNSYGLFYYTSFLDGEILYNDVWNNSSRNYHNNLAGGSFAPQPGTGEISEDPLFADVFFHLTDESPCRDTGHPGPEYNDQDGSRNDMGAYGGSGAGGQGDFPGSGFIFTSVGNIPTSEIVQELIDPSHGLAVVDPCAAAMFSIPAYLDAPFGSSIRIHGLFGDVDIANGVRYYQILAAKWNEDDEPPAEEDYAPLRDSLYKVKYIPQPDGTVLYLYVHIGAKEIKGVDDCYDLTYQGWWSHIDVRIIWNTRLYENGKYTLKCKAFKDDPINPDALLEYHPLPNDLDHLTLIVDNSPVEAVIHSVKYDPCNINYDPCTDGEIPECGIIGLMSETENLRFTITAHHPNGYLRHYILDALWGKNHNAGVIARDTYAGVIPPDNWPGVVEEEFNSADAPSLEDWRRCAYQFRLRSYTRATNGYGYLTHYPYSVEFNDHYFLDFGLSLCDRADIDGSGTVDINDFAIMSAHWLETCGQN